MDEAGLRSRIEVDESGCHVWTGAIFKSGYGAVRWNGKTRLVHRVVFELDIGPIPDGLHLDHECFNRPCCNVGHLEPVTIAENNRRAKARRTTCLQGHPYDGVKCDGSRTCSICLAAWQAGRYQRERADPIRWARRQGWARKTEENRRAA